MKKIVWFFALMIYCLIGFAQSVEEKLSKAVQLFEKDSQMRHAILGLAVMDAKTGAIVFERNSQVGLAPASTQKIVTSAAAFELLGKDFRYETKLSYNGNIKAGVLNGYLYVEGSGDPTFGSQRYASTRSSVILGNWSKALQQKGVRTITGGLVTLAAFVNPSLPDGWIWQDIGNYYGAGARLLNWKENQYDLILSAGDKVGDEVEIVKSGSKIFERDYYNVLSTAAKGSGDNAYIYFPIEGDKPQVRGTIPAGEKSFSISGAMSDPDMELRQEMESAFAAASIRLDNTASNTTEVRETKGIHVLHSYLSPTLDSINYWFMRRSINLYGEALINTMGYQEMKTWATDTGVRVVRDFWATKGIDKAAINIIDGSGLSPQNRVTPDALVQILKYAQGRPWYQSFYLSIPTFNGMKLKSGSIGGARAFAGYHTSTQGKEYIVAIIVNNHAGSSGEIVKKMYKVLDELK